GRGLSPGPRPRSAPPRSTLSSNGSSAVVVIVTLARICDSRWGAVGMKEEVFLYDIFFSYNLKDEEKVRKIYEKFRDAGLRPFFAPVDLSELVGKDGWEKAILKAIPKSYHLGVYCSKDAIISKWVKREITQFRKNFPQRSQKDHRILAITD